VQSFFGKINFVRRFIPDSASIVKPISKLLRNDQAFEWTSEVQREFSNIKVAIVSFPVLFSPNFDNHFILYFFSSEDTIAAMLTQKNQKGEELQVSFMRKELHDYEMRYSPLEKQAFSLVSDIGYFRTYILNNPIKAYVPYPPVRMMLGHPCDNEDGTIG